MRERITAPLGLKTIRYGVARPITRQPITGQQLLALVREIAPRNALRAIGAGGPATFSHAVGERVSG